MTEEETLNDWLHPKTFEVAVTGGDLTVAQWGNAGPVLLAIHGITASHMQWPYLARELQDEVRFVAPDLRGRGGSRDLPGPYGMKVHADDLIAVLDHLEVESAVVVGHSMGGFVGAIMAMHYPERVSSLVLIDGGFPLFDAPAPDVDVEQILNLMLGPSIERCSMTFESLESCFDFWKQHPSMTDDGAWNEVFEAYVAYDLMGEDSQLHSKVNLDAILGDGRDTLVSEDLRLAPEKVSCPMTLIRAPRGILNEPNGLYSDDVAAGLIAKHDGLTEFLVDDVNHYTLVTSERGAKIVAQHIRDALNRAPV
ncbi:MAG: alpha/beta hydrolase [Actinomycetota bacterium]|nr:alpha/beta hydrolase [Actinomycetota bacterium]